MTFLPDQVREARAEADRLRQELEHAQTLLAEWEALVGTSLPAAVHCAVARVDKNKPYALNGAFHLVAEDRNMWRARARRASDVAGGRG